MNWKYLPKSLLLIIPLSGHTQTKEITQQNLYWIRYYNQVKFTDKMTWHTEMEDRRFMVQNKQHHFITHTRLHYQLFPNLDVAAGFTYSLQSPQFPESTSALVVPEYRGVQEVNFSNKITKKFTFQHRIRLDERFIRKNDKIELQDGFDFNFRIRLRNQATFQLSPIGKEKPLNLKLSNELMVNAGKIIVFNYFDQNRIYLGLEKIVSKNLAIEAGYLNWFQQRSSGKQFFNRNIFRLTILHKINLK